MKQIVDAEKDFYRLKEENENLCRRINELADVKSHREGEFFFLSLFLNSLLLLFCIPRHECSITKGFGGFGPAVFALFLFAGYLTLKFFLISKEPNKGISFGAWVYPVGFYVIDIGLSIARLVGAFNP